MIRNERALNEIVGRLEKSWRGEARKAIDRLYMLIDGGMKTEQAVKRIEKEYPALFRLTGLQDALVEAAAYGYGIMPSILTEAERATWVRSLSEPWTSDDMNLSEKVHGAGVRMRETIVQTIRQQMDKNATWREASRALYDGYINGNDDVIRRQEIPKYLDEVTAAARAATRDNREVMQKAMRAARRVQELSKGGAPTKALQAAYNQLVRASESGSEEMLQNAIEVAINEKSRYVADRIIRTESARAFNSGVMSKVMADDDVVALRWKLNTRHPVFDICDMFAKADMFGLGPGIFPKDKLPKTSIPVHPHCMCRYVEVYDGEVDMDKMRNRTQKAGEEWLRKLSPAQQRAVLGVEGQKQFLADGSWQEYMRGWVGIGKPKYAKLKLQPKSIELEGELKAYNGIAEDIKKEIIDSVNYFQGRYYIRIDGVILDTLKTADKVPVQFAPDVSSGELKLNLIINKDFNWNNNLEELNNRILTKNYNKGILSSKNVRDLVKHEMAHFMTFQECRTPLEYYAKENTIRGLFLPGISWYNESKLDGAETIAEGFVAIGNGMHVSDDVRDLVERFVERWRRNGNNSKV